ncbi:MAG: bifunctional nicotinamidase/pyrazinamidase [Verrucomicrobiia bacterium]
MEKALIIVDVQNDFLPGGALAVSDGRAVIPVANELMRQFEIVIATQDWHPANHKSFAANHPGKKPGDRVIIGDIEQILWQTHCVQNTYGAELASELEKSRITKIIQKGTDPEIDSYSAFFDNARKKETGLADYLKAKNVSDIYVIGLATDYCVKYTVLDGISLGFRVYVIERGCRGVNLHPGDVQKAIEDMKKAGAIVI